MEGKKIYYELVKYMKIRRSTQFTATILILDGVDYYVSATAKTCTKKVFSSYSFQKRTFLQLFGHTLIFSYNLLTKIMNIFLFRRINAIQFFSIQTIRLVSGLIYAVPFLKEF